MIHTRFNMVSWISMAAAILVLNSLLPAKETSVTVERAAARPAGPVTFGAIFARGDIKDAVEVQGLPTQSDIKRRWPDGSVKHAVLTVQLPEAEKGSSKLVLVNAAQAAADKPADYAADLKGLADVQVEFQIHKGPAESVSLRKAIASSKPLREPWLNGPLVREWHFRATPADQRGQADPELEVRFEVRYYPAVKTARVAVIVENSRWTSAGSIPYDVRILVDGKEAYAKKDVGRWEVDVNNVPLKTPEKFLGHPTATRWIKRFWVAAETGAAVRPLDDSHIRYDVAYITSTGLLPRYDAKLVIPENALQGMADRWKRAPREVFQNGFILPYFMTTGGREDIGPLPTWTARYVISQDPRALEAILGNGDLSGSFPVHLRDPKTDWTISIDDHPNYSLNPAATQERVEPRDSAKTPWVLKVNSHMIIDSDHQPSLAYVPYLVTGDFYYLEEMQFWANWNMLTGNPFYRETEKGLLTILQARAVAWSLRQLTHAAALTPDAGPEAAHKAYFENKLANNLARYRDEIDGKIGDKPTDIGIVPSTAISGFGKTPEAKQRFRTSAGWMNNFLAWSLSHTVDQGYTDAIPARDIMCKFGIGIFTHPDEVPPTVGTAYFVAVGEKDKDGKSRYYQTWREVKQGMEKMGETFAEKVAYPDFGGSYSYLARGMLIEAQRAKLPGAADALKWLESQLPNRQKALEGDPTWAFAPAE